MSATAKFLYVQYQLDKVNETQIRVLVGSKLTQSEADEILAVK